MRRFAPAARRAIAPVLSDPDERDGVFQETFLALADPRVFLRVSNAAALGGYVASTARRRALDRLRRRYRESERRDAYARELAPVPASAPQLPLVGFERLVGLLPSTDAGRRAAELVRLRYKEGLSYDEISAQTGVPRGSIGPTLARALRRLADRLADAG